MLAELTPKIQLAQSFGTWSPLVNAANITFSNGNLTAERSTTHATNWMCALEQYVKDYGVWYWETTHHYTGSADVVAGICGLDFDLITRPGDAFSPTPPLNYSVGGPDKSGACRFNGVVTATTAPVASGSVVRHWLDLDAGIYRVAVAGGAWFDVLTWTEQGRALVPVVGFKRPVGTTTSCTANFGASPFAYEIPSGANAGVYHAPFVLATERVASEGFDAVIGGTPAHFMGRIASEQDVELEREGSCWVWGGQSLSRRGQLVVINNDGALDAWREYLWRDAPVILRAGYEGDAYDDFTVWAFARVDTIELTRDARIVLSFADPVAMLARQLQPTTYPSSQANLQLAGQPLPIVYGAPLFCAAARLDNNPTVRDYQLH